MTTLLNPSIVAAPASVPVPDALRPLHEMLLRSGASCEVVLPSGGVLQYGGEPPAFRIRVHSDRAFRRGLDELAMASGYVDGEFELEMDMLGVMDLRPYFSNKLPLALLAKFWIARFLRSTVGENRFAIDSHYALGDDFYLSFIDRRWRFYSHGIFASEDESLEDASEHKLERMYDSLQLRPGMRLLDIGAGWGGVEEYCGQRGIHVTGLTIAPDSYGFVSKLIAQRSLTAEVRLEDFLKHVPEQPYDAIVIYGVIEHIPNYRQFAHHVWDCLRPGGRLYVDASATREKYGVSAFSRQFIWPGTHTFLCLQDLVRELLFHGLDIVEVENETRHYELTMRHWAERFDEARDEIIARWGARTYRAFRLYLWGGTRAFRQDFMQAYSLVAERRADRGPRPGWLRRSANVIRGGI